MISKIEGISGETLRCGSVRVRDHKLYTGPPAMRLPVTLKEFLKLLGPMVEHLSRLTKYQAGLKTFVL